MLTLQLDHILEAHLLDIARKEQQTPAHIINRLLAQYIETRQASNGLVDVAQNLPAIEAFSDKDPLRLQQKLRDEWNHLMLAQAESLTDWDNAEDEVWNHAPAVWTVAEFSDMSLHQALRGMEEEQLLYTVDDLKERWR